MRTLLLASFLALALATPCLAQEAPSEMAGLRLGQDIKQFQDKIVAGAQETDITRQYLTTVALNPLPGYRSGYVTYGSCAAPGRIARVKMNYEDDSREFYETVLAALKKRYGSPQQWRGNPFGTLRIWKWSVKDRELGDISIILQHYSGDDDSFTKGNSIRLAAPKLLMEERACWQGRHPEKKSSVPPAGQKLDLEYFLPR